MIRLFIKHYGMRYKRLSMDIEEQYEKIYRFCYYRVHNRETSQDLTQETFLRFLNSHYKERGKRIRYLYTIARNLCIEESRMSKTEEFTEKLMEDRITVNFVNPADDHHAPSMHTLLSSYP